MGWTPPSGSTVEEPKTGGWTPPADAVVSDPKATSTEVTRDSQTLEPPGAYPTLKSEATPEKNTGIIDKQPTLHPNFPGQPRDYYSSLSTEIGHQKYTPVERSLILKTADTFEKNPLYHNTFEGDTNYRDTYFNSLEKQGIKNIDVIKQGVFDELAHRKDSTPAIANAPVEAVRGGLEEVNKLTKDASVTGFIHTGSDAFSKGESVPSAVADVVTKPLHDLGNAVFGLAGATPQGAAFYTATKALSEIKNDKIDYLNKLAMSYVSTATGVTQDSPEWKQALAAAGDAGVAILFAHSVGLVGKNKPVDETTIEKSFEQLKDKTPQQVRELSNSLKTPSIIPDVVNKIDIENDLKNVDPNSPTADALNQKKEELTNAIHEESSKISEQHSTEDAKKSFYDFLKQTNYKLTADKEGKSDAAKAVIDEKIAANEEQLKQVAPQEPIKEPDVKPTIKTESPLNALWTKLSTGETALSKGIKEGMTFSGSHEAERYVAENSDNPAELANAYLQNALKDKDSKSDYKGQIIDGAGIKMTEDDFGHYHDKNGVTGNVALKYFNKDAKALDQTAMELTEEAGITITPQDIVDHIVHEQKSQQKFSPKGSPIQTKLKDRYAELTGGRDLTPKEALKILEHDKNLNDKKYEQFYNQEFQSIQDAEKSYYEAIKRGEINIETGEKISNAPGDNAIPGGTDNLTTTPPGVSEGGITPPENGKEQTQTQTGNEKGRQELLNPEPPLPTQEPVSSLPEGENKKSLLNRVYEEQNPEQLKTAIEKHGLNYDIESHVEAEQKATDFINEVGKDNALDALRKNQIEGGSAPFVWAKLIDDVHKDVISEKDPKLKADLIEKEAGLINEFDLKARSGGRFSSSLQAVYQVSDLGYKLGVILDRAKEANNGEAVSEILKKRLSELSTKLDDVNERLSKLEKQRSSEPDPIISIPKEKKASLSPEKSARKSELSKKYRGALNDVSRVITLIAEKDFREYAGLVLEEAAGDFKTFSKEMINNVGKEIREHLPKLYKELGGKGDPEMEKIKADLKKQIAAHEEKLKQIKAGTYVPKTKGERSPLDKETFDLLIEKNKIKDEIDYELEKLKLKNRTNSEKIQEGFVDILNLPKSLMASADMSAPLRQGAVLSVKHPIIASKASIEMVKQAFSEEAHQRWLTELKMSPEYEPMKKAGIYIAEQKSKMTAREEQFISSIAHKIPIWGRVVKGSERAYTGYLNKLRVDVFNQFRDGLIEQGLKGKELDKEVESFTNFINNASGRGSLGRFEESTAVLNAAFFSPRYAISRFNLINPLTYIKMAPKARAEALKTVGVYVGMGATVLALAKASGTEVNADPRSSDFGKIKLGNTRFDIFSGFQQWVRLIAQVASGEKVNLAGKTVELGKGYKEDTRADIIGRFLRSKFSPSLGFAWDLLSGKDFAGKPVTFKFNDLKSFSNSKEGQLIMPLWIQDLIDATNDNSTGKDIGAAIASFFGIGVQTYDDKKQKHFSQSK